MFFVEDKPSLHVKETDVSVYHHQPFGSSFCCSADDVYQAYIRWGDSFPSYLQGSFAIVIHDRQRDKLICARDHFGVAPLYYACHQGQYYFGATLQEVAVHLPKLTVDEAYCLEMLTLGLLSEHEYQCHTRYNEVKKVQPGHLLIISKGQSQSIRYWQPEKLSPIFYPKRRDYVEAFRACFFTAVKRRLMGLQKIAIEVSGGLDSSAIAAVARQCFDGEIIALTNAPDKHMPKVFKCYRSEYRYAQQVCRHLGLEQHTLQQGFDLDAALTKYQSQLPHLLETTFNFFNYTHYAYAQSQGCEAVLSGFGGDQFVSQPRFHWLPELRSQRRYWQYVIESTIDKGLVDSLKRVWRRLLKAKRPKLKLAARYQDLLACFNAAYQQKLQVRLQDVSPAASIREAANRHFPGLGRYSGFTSSRPEAATLLLSAHNMQALFPMLDVDLVEFCYRCPSEYKRTLWQDRYLLREIMRPYLPASIRNRKDKTAMTVPGQYVALQQRMLQDFAQPAFQYVLQQTLGEYLNAESFCAEQTLPFSEPVIKLYLNAKLLKMANS